MSAYTFRPRAWAVLLTLLLAAGMTTAGFWQYSRGQQKQALLDARKQEAQKPAQPLLDDLMPAARGTPRKVVVEGMYAPALTVQLDNQPYQQQPGVHIWTPLITLGGEHVIVDRGWLPLGAPVPPPPTGVQRIEGNWKRLPEPGMRLGDAASGCESPRPERVTYPDIAQVRCLFGRTTLDGLLELSADAEGGFTRDWAADGSNAVPPSRHYAYAAQWWLFAATLLALFVKINLRKKSVT